MSVIKRTITAHNYSNYDQHIEIFEDNDKLIYSCNVDINNTKTFDIETNYSVCTIKIQYLSASMATSYNYWWIGLIPISTNKIIEFYHNIVKFDGVILPNTLDNTQKEYKNDNYIYIILCIIIAIIIIIIYYYNRYKK